MEFSIRDLATEFGVTTRTIRFYEDQGLITPLRRGQQRIFSTRDRTRLKLILRGKRLGFSLAEIREIIDMYDAERGELGQLNHFLAKIMERRDDLELKRRDIEDTIDELDEVRDKVRERLRQIDEGAEDGGPLCERS